MWIGSSAPAQSLVPHLLRVQESHPGSNFAARKQGDRYLVYALTPLAVRGVCDENAWGATAGPLLRSSAPLAVDALFADDPGSPAHELVVEGFTPQAMRGHHRFVVAAVDRHLPGFPETARVDVHLFSVALTVDVVSRIVFGVPAATEAERDALYGPFARALGAYRRTFSPTPGIAARLHPKAARELHAQTDQLHAAVEERVARRTIELDGGAPPDGRLLDLVIAARREGRLAGGETVVRDQALALLVAGFDGASATLTIALHYLGQDPELQERIAERVPDGPLRFADLAALRLVRAVVDETTRLWPAAPVFFRQARDTTVTAGHVFAAGDRVAVLPQLTGRTRELFGATADDFEPRRFADPHQRRALSHAVKPFGTGARACVGWALAAHELVAALAALVKRHRLESTGDLAVREVLGLRPLGVTLKVADRG